jgi:3-deoxy-D-manno-octulosonic-acid transferase
MMPTGPEGVWQRHVQQVEQGELAVIPRHVERHHATMSDFCSRVTLVRSTSTR